MSVHIQWKGTKVCLDFTCDECGSDAHVDADFVYNLRCWSCGTVWAMPHDVQLRRAVNPNPDLIVDTEEPDQ